MPNHDYLPQTKTLLSQLVAFPVLGGQSNLSIAQFIGTYLEQAGVKYHKVDNEAGTKTAIHCRIGPAIEGGVILSGHMMWSLPKGKIGIPHLFS